MAYDLNAALAQYGYTSSTPMPGESATEFYARKNREYMAQVDQSQALAQQIKDMQAQQQLQQQWEQALQSHGLWSPSQQESQAEIDAKLERERQLAFGALNDQKAFYDQGTAAELEQSLLGQMRGTDSPFSPTVVSNLVARETDAEAGQLRSEQDLIRSRMANSGLGGSGIATSAMLSAQREASKRSRSASRDIRTRAELENFNARERARSQAQSFVQQEAANRAAAIKQEVDLRSRFQVVGDDRGMDKLAAALAPQMAAASQAPVLPQGYQGRATGNEPKAQYGGVTFLNGQGVNPFMQTTQSTGYQNFGLGGSAGPWGAISSMHDQAAMAPGANRNYGNQSYTGFQYGRSSNPYSPFAPGGSGTNGQPAPWAPQTQEGLWDQLQNNAVAGSATARGSQGHHAWLGERARFNVR